jgi:transposase
MTTNYDTTDVNTVPIAKQLSAIFRALPDKELLNALKARTGRPGYTAEVMWKTYIAMVVLGLPTFASLIRSLQNNPMLAVACGITDSDGIPTKYAYSRFVGKLSQPCHVVMVKDIMRNLTRSLYDTLPNFGKSVAIDSTDIKAWSNGSKNPVADPDATWAAKLDTAGKKKFYYGYKVHLIVDTTYELPVAAQVTTGSAADVRIASRVLSEARFTTGKFYPDYVIADAGYCSRSLRLLIKRQYRGVPIIKVNKAHKKSIFVETEEWRALYSRRTAIERVNARLKCYRRLNNVTVRRKQKVTVHCFLSLIVVQAQALHNALNNQIASVRQCVSVP